MFDPARWPVFVSLPLCFLLVFGTAVLARVVLLRHKDPERRAELQTHAEKVLTPVSASLAFLIGFCITITWGGVSAGQSEVEATAAAAREIVWAQQLETPGTSGAISEADSGRLTEGLVAFLTALGTQDNAAFQNADVEVLPSMVALRAFERDVHRVITAKNVNPVQVSALESASIAMAAAHAEIIAISRRALPPMLTALVILNAVLLGMVMGMSMAGVRRPILMVAWCFVTALAICVVLQLDRPFDGSISVSLEPVSDVAYWISHGIYVNPGSAAH